MKKYIKYISYGVVSLITLAISLFVITEREEVKAGASHSYSSPDVCYEWPSNHSSNHTDSQVIKGHAYYNSANESHCHKSGWNGNADDDGGDGGGALGVYEFLDK